MEKEYLIHKRPASALLIFALPMMLGNFFQQVYTMADSVIVGRFVGEDALAAVGASYSLTNVFISIAIGGGVGASVITSQTFGARDYSRMKRSISTALLSFLAISILLGAVGLTLSRRIMVLLNAPANILEDSITYLNIYFLGLPFLFMYNVLSSMFNALGRSRIPLYLLIFSSVLNVALDIYMVTVLNLGVAGVAWATLIAQGISAVLSFSIFLKELRSYPGKLDALFDWKELKNMGRVALPSILQQSTVSIGMMLVQSVVNSFGSQMLAGYSAAMRIESVCIVPMSAMGNAISSYTAQNVGANKPERVKSGYRASYGIVFAIAAVICLVVQLLARPLISLFLEDGSSAAFETGIQCTRFMAWFYVLIGLKMI
ncbi:MAG: MATE family efflux transporter, partial [Acutalibacter sp.]